MAGPTGLTKIYILTAPGMFLGEAKYIFFTKTPNNMDTETKPLIRASHVIANEDSYQLHKDVENFLKDKPNATTLKNTTPIMAGMTMVGKQPVAQMKVIVTCLIEWDSTEEDFRLYRKRLELTGKPF